jgi:hypothetical protein
MADSKPFFLSKNSRNTGDTGDTSQKIYNFPMAFFGVIFVF